MINVEFKLLIAQIQSVKNVILASVQVPADSSVTCVSSPVTPALMAPHGPTTAPNACLLSSTEIPSLTELASSSWSQAANNLTPATPASASSARLDTLSTPQTQI